MLIDKLISEWDEMNYRPTYQELLEVKAEQEKLIRRLNSAPEINDLPPFLKDQAS